MFIIDNIEYKIRRIREDIRDDNIQLDVRNKERQSQITYLESLIEEVKKLTPKDVASIEKNDR